MNKDKLDFTLYYTNDIKLPKFNDIINNDINQIKKDSDMFLNQFSKIIDLNESDKLCVIDNVLVIQKFTPWRYFVRKYKKQNRKTLSIYLNTQMDVYSKFLYNMIDFFNINQNNRELYRISVKHYDFIQLCLPKIIALRNKYSLKEDALDLRKSLEVWSLKLIKFKKIFIELISNKRLN